MVLVVSGQEGTAHCELMDALRKQAKPAMGGSQ